MTRKDGPDSAQIKISPPSFPPLRFFASETVPCRGHHLARATARPRVVRDVHARDAPSRGVRDRPTRLRRGSSSGRPASLAVRARASRFSESFGDAVGAPKPGMLQSPPLYVKRTLRAGQVVRHPGTVIVRAARPVASPRHPRRPSPRRADCSYRWAFYLHTRRAHPSPSHRSPRPRPLHQVLGDCNQNSSVIAGGDVFVWGSLRGDVIAGSKGDVRARVFSIDLRPDSVTIGGVKSTAKQSAAARAVSIATGIPECAQVDSNGSGIIMTPANDSARRLAEDVEEKNAVRHFGASARKAAAVTGAYIAAAGVALMIEPARVFGLLFSIEAITDAWIRVFGVLCVAFGTYYPAQRRARCAGWRVPGDFTSPPSSEGSSYSPRSWGWSPRGRTRSRRSWCSGWSTSSGRLSCSTRSALRRRQRTRSTTGEPPASGGRREKRRRLRTRRACVLLDEN